MLVAYELPPIRLRPFRPLEFVAVDGDDDDVEDDEVGVVVVVGLVVGFDLGGLEAMAVDVVDVDEDDVVVEAEVAVFEDEDDDDDDDDEFADVLVGVAGLAVTDLL